MVEAVAIGSHEIALGWSIAGWTDRERISFRSWLFASLRFVMFELCKLVQFLA